MALIVHVLPRSAVIAPLVVLSLELDNSAANRPGIVVPVSTSMSSTIPSTVASAAAVASAHVRRRPCRVTAVAQRFNAVCRGGRTCLQCRSALRQSCSAAL